MNGQTDRQTRRFLQTHIKALQGYNKYKNFLSITWNKGLNYNTTLISTSILNENYELNECSGGKM